MADDDVLTCPQGHKIARSELQMVEGRYLCPACAGQSVGWADQPVRWSRRALTVPLWVSAVGALVLGGGDLALLVTYVTASGTTNNGVSAGYLLGVLGWWVVAMAAVIAAVFVRRP